MAKRSKQTWPYFPPQFFLLFAAIAVFVGSFLPWALVLGQSLRGAPLAVSWTLWAGLMMLAGTFVRWRLLFLLSGGGGGGVAVGIGLWQTARIFERCSFSLDCLPGPGLGLLVGGGLVALYVVGRFVYEQLRWRQPRP